MSDSAPPPAGCFACGWLEMVRELGITIPLAVEQQYTDDVHRIWSPA